MTALAEKLELKAYEEEERLLARQNRDASLSTCVVDNSNWNYNEDLLNTQLDLLGQATQSLSEANDRLAKNYEPSSMLSCLRDDIVYLSRTLLNHWSNRFLYIDQKEQELLEFTVEKILSNPTLKMESEVLDNLMLYSEFARKDLNKLASASNMNSINEGIINSKTLTQSCHREDFNINDKAEHKTQKPLRDFLCLTPYKPMQQDWTEEDHIDVAAYDAAMARDEEYFPIRLFDAIEAGESPVRVFRDYREMTQLELAEKSGVKREQISQIENGKAVGTAQTLKKLSVALHVPLEELVP